MVDASDVGEVVVHAEGRVSAAELARAHEKVAHVGKFASGRVLFAKVDLVAYNDPARERPSFAKAELDVGGHIVRARAAASNMFDAIDLLEARLRERLERRAHGQEARHLRHRDDDHAWHHGDAPEQRTQHFPRPVEEREIVRRKSFAAGKQTPRDAALDLEQLDHDFYLFRNIETDEDNVVHRIGDGRYELLAPSAATSPTADDTPIELSPVRPSEMTLDDAVELLDLGDLAFVFFLDPQTRDGSVLYRRYDGHYGLIDAARNAG
jgi:ribosome-associated translation inhibitor RaiA